MQNDIEKGVLSVCAKVLHIKAADVSRDADLTFDLGADSIARIEILYQLEDIYGVDLSERDWKICDKVTPKVIAEAIKEELCKARVGITA